MDTTQIVAWIAAGLFLVLYLARRRRRLNRED
jgi:hypothetical protein